MISALATTNATTSTTRHPRATRLLQHAREAFASAAHQALVVEDARAFAGRHLRRPPSDAQVRAAVAFLADAPDVEVTEALASWDESMLEEGEDLATRRRRIAVAQAIRGAATWVWP